MSVAEAPKCSVRGRRVPKGQQPVKIEFFDCLDGRRVLDAAGQCGQPHGIERGGGRQMDEVEVAETRPQTPIAHRPLGIDVLLTGEPGERDLLAAQLIQELELDRL